MPLYLERFRAYHLGLNLSKVIIDVARSFPRGHGDLRDQIDRAATSIVANIAEGAGRASVKDKRHFYAVARGSLMECIALLQRSRNEFLIEERNLMTMKAKADILAKMLSRLISPSSSKSS